MNKKEIEEREKSIIEKKRRKMKEEGSAKKSNVRLERVFNIPLHNTVASFILPLNTNLPSRTLVQGIMQQFAQLSASLAAQLFGSECKGK